MIATIKKLEAKNQKADTIIDTLQLNLADLEQQLKHTKE